jgi:hypothetical protein
MLIDILFILYYKIITFIFKLFNVKQMFLNLRIDMTDISIIKQSNNRISIGLNQI